MNRSTSTRKFEPTFLLFIILLACSSPKKEANSEKKQAEEESSRQDGRKTILFFGNSITAGYQLEIEQAFPALIQIKLDSLAYDYQVINAGLSGETTAGGKNRIDWVLSTVPDVFFLELGANDGLRGLPLEETKKNLQDIIDAVVAVNREVKVILAGMQVPPNLGQNYTETFQDIFPELAKTNKATLIPFILEGVAGYPDLNLEDGIHPTAEGHVILAETVWKFIEPMLQPDANNL